MKIQKIMHLSFVDRRKTCRSERDMNEINVIFNKKLSLCADSRCVASEKWTSNNKKMRIYE